MKKIALFIITLISIHSFCQNINLDNSFGDNGFSVLDRIDSYLMGTRMELQSDGKILVTGYVESTSTNFLCRLNSDGSIDSNFEIMGM